MKINPKLTRASQLVLEVREGLDEGKTMKIIPFSYLHFQLFRYCMYKKNFMSKN